jgi:hypothetical protein
MKTNSGILNIQATKGSSDSQRLNDQNHAFKNATIQSIEEQEEQHPFGLGSSKNQSQPVLKMSKKLHETIKSIEDAVGKIEHNVQRQSEHILETTKNITQEYLNSYKEDFQERINSEKTFQ